jgi:membrane-bound metal-dependent hydrolase YbcI (DUF457 family)
LNGKTHQVSGMTAVFATTAVAIQAHEWVLKSLPDWLVPWFSPPPTLLAAAQLLTPAEARTAMVEGALPANTVMTTTTATSGSPFTGIPTNLGGLAHYAVDTGAVLLTLLGIALLGLVVGQLPDLDTPYSTISNGGEAVSDMIKGKGWLKALIRFVFNVLNFIPQLLSLFAGRMMGGHRNGIVHGLLGWLGFSALFSWFAAAVLHQPFYGLLFLVAYFTHLIVDTFSHSGIKWFWPLTDRSYHLLPKSLRFYTANPLHNAMAQIASVLLADWAIYSLIASLSRGDKSAQALANSANSPSLSILELVALGVLIIISLILIAGITLAAIADQRQFRREEQRARARQRREPQPQYYRRYER